MKATKTELTIDLLSMFALSNEEMINVRGGESEPIIKPTIPPVRI